MRDKLGWPRLIYSNKCRVNIKMENQSQCCGQSSDRLLRIVEGKLGEVSSWLRRHLPGWLPRSRCPLLSSFLPSQLKGLHKLTRVVPDSLWLGRHRGEKGFLSYKSVNRTHGGVHNRTAFWGSKGYRFEITKAPSFICVLTFRCQSAAILYAFLCPPPPWQRKIGWLRPWSSREARELCHLSKLLLRLDEK